MPHVRTIARLIALCGLSLAFWIGSTAHRKSSGQRLSSGQILDRTAALCSAITQNETLRVTAEFREQGRHGIWDAVCTNPVNRDNLTIGYDAETGAALYAAVGVDKANYVAAPVKTESQARACARAWIERLRFAPDSSASIQAYRSRGAPNWTVIVGESEQQVVLQIDAANGLPRMAHAARAAFGWVSPGPQPHPVQQIGLNP